MGFFQWLFGLGGKPSSGGAKREKPRTPLGVLAGLLKARPKRLAWVLYHHPSRYTIFTIPKRSGATRRIDAPCPALKSIQRAVLRRILDKVPAGQAAHGFRRQRSILTNARFHVGQPLVVRLDIKDFFPTITWPRVFGLFRGLGHDRPTAGMLANLCTHQGVLPQGAPTSPAISNLVCLRLDARLLALACKAGGRYTRYADDMTFSGPLEIKGILPTVRKIVAEEGFQVASEKTRLARRCRQQLVTGLVVNERPNVPRRRRRLIRAIVHNAARQGLASQNRQNHPHFAAWLAGWVRFIRMVNPAHGDALLRKLGQVRP